MAVPVYLFDLPSALLRNPQLEDTKASRSSSLQSSAWSPRTPSHLRVAALHASPCQNAAAAEDAALRGLGQRELAARRRRKTRECLLQRIDLEIARRRANDRHDTAVVRAVVWALRGVSTAEHVADLVGELGLSMTACSSIIQKLGREGHADTAVAFVAWMRTLEPSDPQNQLRKASSGSNLADNQHQLPAALQELNSLPTSRFQGDATDLSCMSRPLSSVAEEANETSIAEAGLISTEDRVMNSSERVSFDSVASQAPLGKPNVFIYNSLLGALKANGEYEKAQSTFVEMREEGISPDRVTFNTLISLYVQQPETFNKSWATLCVMRQQGISPDLFTVRTLLPACIKSGQPERALDLLEIVKGSSERQELNNGSVSGGSLSEHGSASDKSRGLSSRERAQMHEVEAAVRAACSREVLRQIAAFEQMTKTEIAAAVQRCIGLLHRLKAVGIKADRLMYRAVITACCAAPLEFQKVLRTLLSEMREMGYEPDVGTCNRAMAALGEAKKWWAALELFETMKAKGPEPNEQSVSEMRRQFNQLLLAGRRRRIWKWCVLLLDRMLAAGVEPDQMAWDSTLVACARSAQTEAAIKVFEEMVERGAKPGGIAYVALLSALEKGDMLERAEEVWEHMGRTKAPFPAAAFTTMIAAYGKRGEYSKAVKMFEMMQDRGEQPDVVAYNALVTSCAYSGEGTRALDWLEKMESDPSISPNHVTYEQVLVALANDGQWEAAISLLERMRQKGIQPSKEAVALVARMCNSCRGR